MSLLTEETIGFIRFHRKAGTDLRHLALQGSYPPGVDRAEALTQLSGWQTALRKLPSWAAVEDLVYPPHLSMEQCSSEQAACYKAEQILSGEKSLSGGVLVDLTGGFGVDFSWMARGFSRVVYVERQPILCDCARHNFPLLGLPLAEVVQAEAETYLREMPPADWIYLDPARRDAHGGKVVRLADCQPDVGALLSLLQAKAGRILVKLSPMLDLTQVQRDLPGAVQAIHVVAVRGECKEILLVLTGTKPGEGPEKIRTLDFRPGGCVQRFDFFKEEEETALCEYATEPLTYLYEPNAAILKAGAYRLPAVRFGVKKLHPDSHLYTSDEHCDEFPGRCFRVQGFSGFGKKELKCLLGDLKQAHLTVRGFPETVSILRKRLALKEGGDTYCFAATVSGGQKILIRSQKEQLD